MRLINCAEKSVTIFIDVIVSKQSWLLLVLNEDYIKLSGPGIESRVWAIYSASDQTGPGDQPASCTMGTVSFPGVKYGQGVTLTPHPLLGLRSWKNRAIPLPTSEPQPGL
jgi:hypothetical protein